MNNTLVKGLALLELVAGNNQPLSLAELSEKLGLVKSNVHRLLQALLELRYVRRDEDAYQPGIALLNLSAAVSTNFDLLHVAMPVMKKVLEQTRETVHLSVLDGHEVVYLGKLDSPEPVRAYSEVGGRAPAHCVATGKALLAFQAPEAVAQLAARLKPYSPKSITRPDKFLAELRSVVANGYAVNRGEWRESVRGVAAPIAGPNGRVVAAIGISGPAHRIKASDYAKFGNELIKAASSISAALRGNVHGRDTETMMAEMKRPQPRASRSAEARGRRKAA